MLKLTYKRQFLLQWTQQTPNRIPEHSCKESEIDANKAVTAACLLYAVTVNKGCVQSAECKVSHAATVRKRDEVRRNTVGLKINVQNTWLNNWQHCTHT